MANINTMPRLIVYDRLDTYKFELDPNKVRELRTVEQINGEHSLTIVTTQVLARSDRILMQDAMGYWHEWVVLGDEVTHENVTVHEYYCVWSLQYDLMGTYIDTHVGLVPGHASQPCAARLALEAALSGTSRWGIGTIGVTSQSSASFYRRSGWDGIKTVIENWGGEINSVITVASGKVSTRKIDLLEHVGSSTVTRRFDYGADLTKIKADLPEQPLYCRIVPLSKSEQTENGGYTRRKTIASVNSNVVWLEDSAMVPYAKVPDGNGGYEYPTLIVENDTYEDVSDLKTWAQAHITDYTQPVATYEGSVLQLEQAGMNAHGVALGDYVHVVDKRFGDDGLRLNARVIKQVTNLLDRRDIKLTIGTAKATIATQLGGIASRLAALAESSVSTGDYQATVTYLSNLISELNTQINATGGYTYITEGQGLRTYDTPVADPTSGLEANSVVEIKGGTIRIANSKTSGGDWDWKTVFTSGHVAANLITAANIVSGYIGSASSGTYIDLDSHIVHLGENNGWHMVIDDDSIEMFDGSASTAYFGLQNNNTVIRLGKASNSGKVVCSSDGSVEVGYGSTVGAHFGYGTVRDVNTTTNGTYLTIGTRDSSYDIGHRSATFGLNNAASYSNAFAAGNSSKALNVCAFAMGAAAKSEHNYAFAGGYQTSTGAAYQLIHGQNLLGGTTSGGVVLGRFNTQTTGALIVGQGTSTSSRKNIFNLSTAGNLTIAGTLSQNSDRRLKHHIAYLGDDAAEFVRRLKPVLYEKDGTKQVGFYAQDVEEVEPWQAGIVGRTDGMDERLPDLRTLDYTALIAPLVAYTQQLEERLARLEGMLNA